MKNSAARSLGRKLAALLLWLLAAPSIAAQAEDILVSCKRDGSSMYEIQAQFQVDASSRVAWEVLTDYEHIGHFVPDVRLSKIMEQRPDGVLLEQEARSSAFFFSRSVRVMLSVMEEPFKRIIFRDTTLKNFARYKGSWTLQPSAHGLLVTYRLEAAPLSHIPRFLVRRALSKTATNLLKKVRAELLRRIGERDGGSVASKAK